MEKQLQILYLEDNPSDAGLTQRALRRAGLVFNMLIIETENEFRKALIDFVPDLILSDHSLPGFSSIEAYKIMKENSCAIPFILLTGTVSEQFAVDCLLAGIDDYILKDNLIRLPSSIERVLAKKRVTQEKEIIESLHHELQCVYKQLEEKNKETIDSINYAKRIQNTILPDEEEFNEWALNGFVIYTPRDIVSGDLYWLAKTTTTDSQKLSLNLVATIDCTGHGVPGAFLSLLVAGILNETLKHPEINSPADALKYLNQKLPTNLNKHHKEKIYDGMDMSLCALDLEKRKAYFSGANRPLWLIRKNKENFDFVEFKGTKASIGIHTPFDQKFENHEIHLEQGDRLFMFTDGITDQFGGPNGKKLGRNRLQEILLNSAHMEIQSQKQFLLNFLEEWKGNLEQVDDNLFIGIEIH